MDLRNYYRKVNQTSDDHNFIFLPDWHAPNVVFLSKIFGEGAAHQLSSKVGMGCEVGLSALTTRAGDG